MAKQPQVYVVSDSLGETAESVAKATIGQYDTDIEIHRVPFIRHTDQIEKIIDEAAQAGAVVCHTLVSPELRADFERIAHEKNVRYVDILGPMMNMVTDVAGVQPRMKPGIIHRLDEEYFKKVEAIEFAVRYDDGKIRQASQRRTWFLSVCPAHQRRRCPCIWRTKSTRWQTCPLCRKCRYRKKYSRCLPIV